MNETPRVSESRVSRRALLAWMAAGGASVALLAACGGAAPAPPAASASTAAGTPKTGGTVRVGLDNDLVNLDPHLSTSRVDRVVFYNVFESLVAIDEKLNIKPLLAESWETPDERTYVFKLRKGVKFHDGTDFNAAAVKFNIDRIFDPKFANPRKAEIANVKAAEVVDNYTVKLLLSEPFAPLLANLVDRAGMMLSPAAVQKLGKDFSRNPVGTGPFKFVEWKKDDHLTVEKFADYWDKSRPYLDKAIFRGVTDPSVRLADLKTGNLEVAFDPAPKDVAGLRNNRDVVLLEGPGLSYDGLTFNVKAEPFSNKALRKAVAWTIDRESIVKAVYFNVGRVAYGPITPVMLGFDPEFKPYKQDLAKAKQFLVEGGKPGGFKFTLKIRAGNPLEQQVAQVMKDQMGQVGIEAEIEQVEWGKLTAQQQAHEFQAIRVGWSGRIDPDMNIYQFYRSGSFYNFAQYSDADVDKWLDQARATRDQNERKQLYRKIEEKLAVDDAAYIWYWQNATTHALSPRVQNFALVADQMIRLRDVWLK